jgi:hypothetical protein
MVRAGEYFVAELVTAHFDHIERVNPPTPSLCCRRSSPARRADQVEDGRAARRAGTVKDSSISRDPTRIGSFFARSSRRPKTRRWSRAARGRSLSANEHANFYSYETDNFVTGRTNNPWVERTPGIEWRRSGGDPSSARRAWERWGRIDSRARAFLDRGALKTTPGRVASGAPTGGVGHGAGVMGPLACSVRRSVLFEVLAGTTIAIRSRRRFLFNRRF